MPSKPDDFATWLTNRAQEAGHDTNTPAKGQAIAAIATLASINGLTIADAEGIADVLDVTPNEVAAAHIAAGESAQQDAPHQ
ncbi:hypothetical protein [Streptacidiphilus sp. EB129]|jgi:hypothetical protein|uniref:hypothetical protein n=1 Tax=Streptacidiphilus sp. EB129 TaxID=3156262 RepID=UPI003517EFD3